MSSMFIRSYRGHVLCSYLEVNSPSIDAVVAVMLIKLSISTCQLG